MSEYLCPSCLYELQANEQICPHCGHLRDELQTSKFSGLEYCLPLGTMLHNGRYLVGLKKGGGACGYVYVGLDLKLKKRVAIKELFPFSITTYNRRSSDLITLLWAESEKEKYISRFREEARLMAKADELTGFAHLYDMFYENDTAYLIENYIEGQTMAELEIESHISDEEYWQDSNTSPQFMSEEYQRDLKLEEINKYIQFLVPIMKALNQLHKCGVLHCDINPTNILVDRMGQGWIVDFGKAVQMGGEYDSSQSETCCISTAPPELITKSEKIGPWTDVYSICAMIYMKTANRYAVRNMNDGSIDLSDIPEAYHDVFFRGLAYKPQDRIQNMTELMEAFRCAMQSAGRTEKNDALYGERRSSNTLSDSPEPLRKIDLLYGQIFNSESSGCLIVEFGHVIGKISDFHLSFVTLGIVHISSGGFGLNSRFADEGSRNVFNDQQALLHQDFIIESKRYQQNLNVTVAKILYQERGFRICFDDQIISAVYGDMGWSFLSDDKMIACLIRTKKNVQLLVYEPLSELKVLILTFISWFGT